MSNNIYYKNLTSHEVLNTCEENYSELIREWLEENNLNDVNVVVKFEDKQETTGSNGYLIWAKYLKEKKDELNTKSITNLLRARMDFAMKKLEPKIYESIFYTLYFGFTDSEMEKKGKLGMPESKKKVDDDIVLNVLPIEPQYALEQVILPEKQKTEIEDVIALLKNISKIYHDWGFIDIDPIPRSIVNLWGPPGTGKTMCVHAIAKEMGKKILILNYADIESKYVGDAPKNLVAAFELALKEDAILFFDEADSFLGKRITNVSQGSEQAINSLRSQMLMELEAFNGTVFFATNLHENYDRAFESRILKHIEFVLPDVECRKALIVKKFPKKVPVEVGVLDDELGTLQGELLTTLAEQIDGFSGREIKNCVLEALVRTSKMENAILTKDLLITSFKESKEKFDAIKGKENKKKKEMSSKIKKNLKNKNFIRRRIK